MMDFFWRALVCAPFVLVVWYIIHTLNEELDENERLANQMREECGRKIFEIMKGFNDNV